MKYFNASKRYIALLGIGIVGISVGIISKNITKSELKNILDPETYIGLAVKQAQLIIQDIENKRTK